MYKKILTTAVLAAIAGAAQAQSSVTLYGLIDAGISYTNNENGSAAWQMRDGTVNGSRWGLRGAEDLGGGLKAIFTLESGFSFNNGTAGQSARMFGRQAFVGLASDQFGAVTLGRQYDSIVDYLAPLSLTQSQYGGTLAAHPFDNDNLNNSIRFNNTVKYTGIDVSGFKFGATYSFSNSTQFANNRAYSFGASYNYGPMKFAAGYLQLNNQATSTLADFQGASASNAGAQTGEYTFDAARQRTFGGGASYAFGPATVGLLFTQTNLGDAIGISSARSGSANSTGFGGNSVRFQNIEGNVRYALTPALSLAGSYTYTRSNFGSGLNPNYNSVSLQSDYLLSKRTDVYLQGNYQHVSSAKWSNGKSVGAFLNGEGAGLASSSQSQVAVTVGMRHRF